MKFVGRKVSYYWTFPKDLMLNRNI